MNFSKVACIIRVPMEVVKQRRQTAINKKHTSLHIALKTYKRDGFMVSVVRKVSYKVYLVPHTLNHCNLKWFQNGGEVPCFKFNMAILHFNLSSNKLLV